MITKGFGSQNIITSGLAEDITLVMVGIETGEAFGNWRIRLGSGIITRYECQDEGSIVYRPIRAEIALALKGIETGEAFGKPIVKPDYMIYLSGIPTEGKYGEIEIAIPAQIILYKRRYEYDEITTFLMAG